MAATIIQETGNGTNASANSYITLAECSAYHEEMGNTAWATAIASPDTARITAIIRGCRAIDRLYGKKFVGRPKNYGTQAMEWPRFNAEVLLAGYSVSTYEGAILSQGYIVPDTIVPPEVKKACYEAALLELVTPGSMTPNLDRGGQIKSVQAGSVGVTFADSAPVTTAFTGIDGILRPLLRAAGTDLILG